jgi:hypothetical protein
MDVLIKPQVGPKKSHWLKWCFILRGSPDNSRFETNEATALLLTVFYFILIIPEINKLCVNVDYNVSLLIISDISFPQPAVDDEGFYLRRKKSFVRSLRGNIRVEL